MDERETSEHVRAFMVDLAEHLKPVFPQYATALSGELFGTRLTNERWNRIAAILASMAALPGKCFGPEEHDARNPALSAVVIAQKMASVTFGGRRDAESSLSLVVHLADEIRERMQSKGT
jgi:hypothetical protein